MILLIRNSRKKQEIQSCQKGCFFKFFNGVFYFLYVKRLFFSINLDEVFFSFYAPYKSLFYFIWLRYFVYVSYRFQDIGGLKSDLYEVLFPLKSFEQFLSGVWQHICCSSYCFQDMRGPKWTIAQNFAFLYEVRF